jgi:hypothetical protein
MLFALLLSLAHADFLEPHPRTLRAQTQAAVRPAPGDNWMAVVGDSSSTGAASHPSFVPSFASLLNKAREYVMESRMTDLAPRFADYPSPEEFGITDPVAPATRVVYSQHEWQAAEAGGHVVQKNAEAKASLKLDTEEYSFAYMAGRALGIKPERIVFTGQDGKRIGTMAAQFERILEVGSATLPPLVLVSYVANDFCHPNNFTRPVSEFASEFGGDLRPQFQAIRNMPPDPRGTRIVILAPLDVANLLSNDELLTQRINLSGEEMTCGDLRKGRAASSYRARKLQDILVQECKGVLTPSADPAAHLQRVRDLQKAQLEVLQREAAEFNRTAPSGLRVEIALSTKDIHFLAGDLAGDCFHPGLGAHTKIARQLLSHELKGL